MGKIVFLFVEKSERYREVFTFVVGWKGKEGIREKGKVMKVMVLFLVFCEIKEKESDESDGHKKEGVLFLLKWEEEIREG